MASIFRKRSCWAISSFSFISSAWVWKDEISTKVPSIRYNLACNWPINSSRWVTNPWLACEFRWGSSRLAFSYYICCQSWALIFSKSWLILFLTVCSMASIWSCNYPTNNIFCLSFSAKFSTDHWFAVAKAPDEPATSFVNFESSRSSLSNNILCLLVITLSL